MSVRSRCQRNDHAHWLFRIGLRTCDPQAQPTARTASPAVMSTTSLASWAGSRGRFGGFSGIVPICTARRLVSRARSIKANQKSPLPFCAMSRHWRGATLTWRISVGTRRHSLGTISSPTCEGRQSFHAAPSLNGGGIVLRFGVRRPMPVT